MLMPFWPSFLEREGEMSLQQSGLTMLIFCIGLFIPGCVSSYLLDRYPRKKVCFRSILILLVVSLLSTLHIPVWAVALCRLVQGAAFALFHTALGSTILIDITVSERRDVAAYIYFWVCRFAFAVGPALGILARQPELWQYLKYLSSACAFVAVYLIARLELPFRSPLRTKVFSTDRFWLRHSVPLVILLFPVPMVMGMEMALNMHPQFFLYLLLGFVISITLHFMVFYRADVRAEIVTGFIALACAFLLLLNQDAEKMVIVASCLTGYGVGNVTGRMLSFLTAVSKHTERGSAQVTYKLVFETSLCVGFFLPCIFNDVDTLVYYSVALALMVCGLAFYQLYVHKWFLRNTKR